MPCIFTIIALWFINLERLSFFYDLWFPTNVLHFELGFAWLFLLKLFPLNIDHRLIVLFVFFLTFDFVKLVFLTIFFWFFIIQLIELFELKLISFWSFKLQIMLNQPENKIKITRSFIFRTWFSAICMALCLLR